MLYTCFVCLLLWEVPVVHAQDGADGAHRTVGSAEQLAEAIRAGTPSINLASNITGIVGEQQPGGSVFDLRRYISFPEVLHPLRLLPARIAHVNTPRAGLRCFDACLFLFALG